MANHSLPPVGLYIHLPWCERKCPYCDFNSHEDADFPEQHYVDALLDDLSGDAPGLQGRELQTLFIGGGTPSLFSVQAISRLMAGVAERVALAPDLEATMEANPGSAEADKFHGFRAAGINRLSLGIQSFGDQQLTALGRIHDSSQARQAITLAKAAGFDNFNIDLMHGLPGQTPAAASFDLREALACDPTHLSWYQLTIEANTVFYKKPPVLPVEDALADIQDDGERVLTAANYHQYEVSAYSKAGFQCRHNHNYWSFGDYLGIGAGAHGKITRADGSVWRTAKKRQPGDYLAAGESRLASQRQLDAGDLRAEFMLNSLRLRAGFSLDQYCRSTGLAVSSLEPELTSLVERDLVLVEDDRVRASSLGWRFLDSVIAEFLPS